MVLAEGEYTIIAKNRDRISQRDFTVEAGQNQEVEVLASELFRRLGRGRERGLRVFSVRQTGPRVR